MFEDIEFGDSIEAPQIPIFLYGGGSTSVWFRKFAGERIASHSQKLQFIVSQKLSLTIPQVPEHLQHRYQVVLGLANQEAVMPLRGVPADFKHYWEGDGKMVKHTSIDLEDLQANLYGK
ncbi:hypothetical protein [uncultured Sphaerochaeta sp.]|uniref:hypothetical protein n=1 Tax=uncultured Sphaerochaeta sp. TaxID=886478 RepID=UPI0029C9D0D1|nr:hypothetical protein [uncultured Sphaerochaeta sp.]